MSENPAREERLDAFLDEMRVKYPHQPDSHWEDLVTRQRLQWKVDDLREGIAWLVGAYGFQAGQQPENASLAALVGELAELLKTGHVPAAGTREEVTS